MPRRDVTKNFVRHRQAAPKSCAPGSFRTIARGKAKLVVCCPRGQWNVKAKRCKVGMKAQSILKPRGLGAAPVDCYELNKAANRALQIALNAHDDPKLTASAARERHDRHMLRYQKLSAQFIKNGC